MLPPPRRSARGPAEVEFLELISFETGKTAPSIIISPGSGGRAYVFAELGFRMHARAYNVFIMAAHGGRTITELVQRHMDVLWHVAGMCNDRIGIFGGGLAAT